MLNKDYTEETLRAVAATTMVPQVFINGPRSAVPTTCRSGWPAAKPVLSAGG